MTVGWYLVSGSVVGSLLLTLGFGIVLVPDAELYLDSGLALYPSPLGTALGTALGLTGLAVVHAVFVGTAVALVWRSQPSPRALLLALPSLAWLVPLGMDAIAAVLLVGGVVLGDRVSPWLAALLHAAAIPVALALAVSRTRRALLLVPVAGVGALLVLARTPYGAGFLGRLGSLPEAVILASIVVLLGLGPALVSRRPISVPLVALAAGCFGAALYASLADLSRDVSFALSLFAATRYALPVGLFGLIAVPVSYGRAERPTTAPGSEGLMHRKVFGLTIVVAALVALLVVPAAFAQTVPAIPVGDYGDSLLTSLASAIGQIFPYAAAITAFAIGVGMVKRWLGHRKATRV